MKKLRLPLGKIAATTLGLVIALGLRPVSVREILAAYVLALTALVLFALTRMARTEDEWERSASELARTLAPRKQERMRPAELIRMERDVTLSSANAGELHARLLPELREVVAARLEIPLAEAREQIGDAAWELLRPDAPRPTDRSQPGPPLGRIAMLVDAIERL